MSNPYLHKYAKERELSENYVHTIKSKFPGCCLICLIPCDNECCSEACATQFRLRSSSSELRHEILARDNETCTMCGVDGKSLKKALLILRKACPALLEKKLKELRIAPKRFTKKGSLMDVDHIIRVADGGGAGWSGKDIRDNCTCLCAYEHSLKDNKMSKKEIEKSKWSRM